MAKIKHTKNELKAQRDSLKRFERYLPTLQLKKQQLQMEVRNLESHIQAKAQEEEQARNHLASWVQLYSEPFAFEDLVKVTQLVLTDGNIAGVTIPQLQDIEFDITQPNLADTPLWVDAGIAMLKQLVLLRAEWIVMREQQRLLNEELRVTNQRVNLFEKVKIPECRENIREIRIFLGDEQTAAVVRSKIAKGKTEAKKSVAA